MFDHLMQSMDDFQKEVNNLSTLASRSGQQFNAMTMMNEAKAVTMKKDAATSKRLAESVDKLKHSAIGFTQSALDGRTGMSKYASSLNSSTEGLTKLFFGVGKIGKVMGVFGSVIGHFVEQVLQQNDKFLESYDSLSDIGIAAGMTATELRNTVLSSQRNIKYLPSFMSALKKLGNNILMLGNTTAQSTIKFAEITKLSDDVYDEFRNLGLSQEQVNELQADYINSFGTLENLRDKDAHSIKLASLRWIKETMAFAAVTGLTRDEMNNSRKTIENDVASQLRLADMKDKNQSANLREIAAMMESVQAGFGVAFISEMTTGVSGNENYTKAMTTLIPEYEKMLKDMHTATKGSVSDSLAVLKKYAHTTIKSLQDSKNDQTNLLNDLTTKNMTDAMDIQSKMLDMLRTVAKSESLDEVKRALDNTAVEGDKLTKARNSAIGFENKLARVMQQFIDLVSGPITSGFQWLLEGINALLDAMMESKIFEWLTGNKVTSQQKLQRHSNFGTVESGQKGINKLTELELTTKKEMQKMIPDSGFVKNRTYDTLPTDISAREVVKSKYVDTDTLADYNEKAKYLKEIQKQQLDAQKRISELRGMGQKNTPKIETPTTTPTPTPIPVKSTTPTPTNLANDIQKVLATPAKQTVTPPKNVQPQSPTPINSGVVTGPSSGFPVSIDSPKAIIPLPDGKNIPVNIMGLDSVTNSITSLNTKVTSLNDMIGKSTESLHKTITTSIDKMTAKLNKESSTINVAAPQIDMLPIVAKISEMGLKMNNLAEQIEQLKSLNQQLARTYG